MAMTGIGALILITLIIMAVRRGGAMTAVLGVCLGVIIAGTDGPLADVTNALLTAVDSLFDAVVDLIGGEPKTTNRT